MAHYLKGTVEFLIQLPTFEHWQVLAVHFLEDEIEGADGTAQSGGIGEIEL